MTGRWPDPGDDRTDIARQIARSYRQLALEVAPERCVALDSAARELGQLWIAPRDTDSAGEEELVSTATAAAYLGVDEATIRGWVSKPGIPVHRHGSGPDNLDMRELLAYKASQRRRRGHR